MDLGGTGGVWISDTTGTADAASDGAGGREVVSFVAGKGIRKLSALITGSYISLLYMLVYL